MIARLLHRRGVYLPTNASQFPTRAQLPEQKGLIGVSEPRGANKHETRRERTRFRGQLLEDPRRKAALDAALAEQALACVDHFGATGRAVAAYNPLSSEPGPDDLPDRLAVRASKVWLPISLPAGELAWALHGQSGVPGALGITEPAGARFNSNVLRSCALLLVPALAVDRGGMRLGKGAGYYDRALACLPRPAAPVVAVVYDEDIIERVPHDAHDVPVDAVVTPSGFFTVRGNRGGASRV